MLVVWIPFFLKLTWTLQRCLPSSWNILIKDP